MDLKSVTYTSRARLDLSASELGAIHETARHFNALNGITGLLAFNGTRFLQIIEGPGDAIDELVERLRGDPRHSAFEIRDERAVSRRSFSSWSMELVRVSPEGEEARKELASMLPSNIAPEIQELALRMAANLSESMFVSRPSRA